MAKENEVTGKIGDQAAFPCLGNVAHEQEWLIDYGMSYRQWLIGQALNGLCTPWDGSLAECPESAGKMAVKMADATLVALEEPHAD